MKKEKELYQVPTVVTVNLMGSQQILAGSGDLDSNIDALDILGDDSGNWGGII